MENCNENKCKCKCNCEPENESELERYAKSEFALVPNCDARHQKIHECILDLIRTYASFDNTDGLRLYILKSLHRLFEDKPLTPLTGDDNEWCAVNASGEEQNKRCKFVFRRNGEAYWTEARVFSDDDGKTWYTCRYSHDPIDSFPYDVPDVSEFIQNNPSEFIQNNPSEVDVEDDSK